MKRRGAAEDNGVASGALVREFEQNPFAGYAYSYPHKTAYRPLVPSRELARVWEVETGPRHFYMHLPFCEVRCGFCNLFTTTGAGREGWIDRYLEAVERQMRVAAAFVGASSFHRGAIGGGTPTVLDQAQWERVFAMIRRTLGAFPEGMPLSVEASPGTVQRDAMRLLRAHGVTRLSLGVQSFDETETRALGRPQDPAEVHRALAVLEEAGFPVVNVDLIYGIPGQDSESWRRSLEATLRHRVQEIYLYPLYVRPLTGLDRLGREPEDNRLELYRVGRDFLCERGFVQVSMRLFRRPETPGSSLAYCCQEDGMMGFGAGARSYSRDLHYSTEYAVGQSGVRGIIEAFMQRGAAEFGRADYGCALNPGEQRRRDVIKSLLRTDGLDLARYQARFGTEADDDFPQLEVLEREGLARRSGSDQGQRVALTDRGMEFSDAIGPWLFSEATLAQMRSYALA